MKKPIVGFVLSGLLITGTGFLASAQTGGNEFSAGAARINITPGTPIHMSGYDARTEVSKGVHDELFASALVFGSGKVKAAVVAMDVIGVSHEFSTLTLKRIENETGIRPEYILLCPTHTHGGPVNLTYGEKSTPEIERYVAELQNNIVAVVKQAMQKMVPAKIGAGKGTCTMNISRRARYADGSIWLGRNPDGPCDHDVSVVRVDDADSNPMAVFVNWPCHGTVNGQDNYYITADWPGSAARYVEKQMGQQIIVPVTAGASGDINPIYGPNTSFEDIDAIGMLVGEEVVRVAKEIKTYPGAVSAGQMSVTAKGKLPSASRFPNEKLMPGPDREIRLSILKIGNIIFSGVSGELMTEIGMQVKKASPYTNTIIITHCNGSSGYLCTDAAFPLGGYEAMVTETMPGTENLIVTNLLRMIQTLP
jgi:hypothetical protein